MERIGRARGGPLRSRECLRGRRSVDLHEPFLPVRCGERVVLVNKSYIARVTIR